MKSLILASGSRYRRELLNLLGLPFEVRKTGVDETPEPAEHPGALAARLARSKAMSLEIPHTVVIGSDQVASLDGEILRKPGNAARTLEQLLANLDAVAVTLTAAQVARLDEASHPSPADYPYGTAGADQRSRVLPGG